MKTTRREFLQTAASAGLVLMIDAPAFAAASEPEDFSPNAYIQIGSDNIIRLWVTRSEMGQGVRTTLPMVLAESSKSTGHRFGWSRHRPFLASREFDCGLAVAEVRLGPTTPFAKRAPQPARC